MLSAPFRAPGGGRLGWFGVGVIAAAACFLGYALLLAPPGGQAPPPPRPTPVPVLVQVAGEVPSPGVYQLPASARLEDALRLAGGLTDQADPSRLSRAARVTDGQRIVVPRKSAPPPTAAPPAPAAQGARLNLNTATPAELQALPGLGPAAAHRIIEQRRQAPFTSVEQLRDLRIVTRRTFARLKDLVGVE